MRLFATVWIITCLACIASVSGYVAPASRTLFRRIPSLPIASSTVHGEAQKLSPTHTSGSPAMRYNVTTTVGPSPYPESCSNCCLLGNPGGTAPCTWSRTWDGPSLSLTENCVLWDSSCSGNITTAAQYMFESIAMIDEKPCWRHDHNASFGCTDYEPAENLAAMSKLKDWMRKPACMSSSYKYHSPLDFTISTLSPSESQNPNVALGRAEDETCCGLGIIHAENVDIFYWPEPNANTACLDIIGTSVHPPLYGATTGSGSAYWACTPSQPLTSIANLTVGLFRTETVVQSIITLARMTHVGSVTFKQSMYNPWSPPPCIGLTPTVSSSVAPTQTSNGKASIQARAHSLVLPTSTTHQDGTPVSTLVSGTFTL